MTGPTYEDIATKFFEHFLNIAKAMTNVGGDGHGVGLWDEQDGFYYDALNLPDGRTVPLKVRSLVGSSKLMSRRQGPTIKELSAEVGVDKRTIRRDLNTLRRAGFCRKS